MSLGLAGGAYRLTVDPTGGGAVLSAQWRSQRGDWIALLAPADGSVPPFKAGCFAMLPFANRIADGRFRFGGKEIALPVNLPDERMAIHGFAREHPWAVVSADEASLVMEQDFAQGDNPYRYQARQEISLSENGIRIALSVCNIGDEPMPFGMGLHPWFVKTDHTKLAFRSSGSFERDEAGLPLPRPVKQPVFDRKSPKSLGFLPLFDGFFPRWRPQTAEISRPEQGLRITLEADGALRHLHVFVPDNRPVFCAEPVSHAPDAVNRPELGQLNAMDVLEPGAMLSGSMWLQASPLQLW